MNSSILKTALSPTIMALAFTVQYAMAESDVIADDPGSHRAVGIPAMLNGDATIANQGPPDALKGYWTHERLKNAAPLPLPQIEPASRGQGTRSSSKHPPSFVVEATSPAGASYAQGYASVPVVINTKGLRWKGTNTLAARVNGKLWFSATDGKNYFCSASTVASAGESLIVTASHCVRNAKGYYTNFLYIPDYSGSRGMTSPYGKWTAKQIFSVNDEGQTGDNDVAFITLNPDEQGRHIETVTGASGLIFNISDNVVKKRVFRFGYSGGHDYGQQLTYCYNNGKYENKLVKHQCNMKDGSNGGPVVTDFPHDNDAYGLTFGVTSVSYGGAPGFTGQAPFNDTVFRLYQKAGQLLPEIYVDEGYIKIKNAYHNRGSQWFVYSATSADYSLGKHAQVKISDILTPAEGKPYLKDADVIYVYALAASTQANYTEGEAVKSGMVAITVRPH